jgi:hypothetical protein
MGSSCGLTESDMASARLVRRRARFVAARVYPDAPDGYSVVTPTTTR